MKYGFRGPVEIKKWQTGNWNGKLGNNNACRRRRRCRASPPPPNILLVLEYDTPSYYYISRCDKTETLVDEIKLAISNYLYLVPFYTEIMEYQLRLVRN